jgi:hypothetical protein
LNRGWKGIQEHRDVQKQREMQIKVGKKYSAEQNLEEGKKERK